MTTGNLPNNTIQLIDVRLSFLHCFAPFKGDNGESYCVNAIVEPNHPQLGALSTIIRRVALEKFKEQTDAMLAQMKAANTLCLHRGETKANRPEYVGKLFVSASNKRRPRIVATVGGVNTEVDEDHPKAPYSGCRGSVLIDIWAQNNKWGKRINATLLGVQFLRHDERLTGGGRIATVDEFALAPEDADSMPTDGGPEPNGNSSLV